MYVRHGKLDMWSGLPGHRVLIGTFRGLRFTAEEPQRDGHIPV